MDFKKEIWYPEIFDRYVWDKWEAKGKKSIVDVALEVEAKILKNHEQYFLEDELRKECESVLISFEKELALGLTVFKFHRFYFNGKFLYMF